MRIHDYYSKIPWQKKKISKREITNLNQKCALIKNKEWLWAPCRGTRWYHHHHPVAPPPPPPPPRTSVNWQTGMSSRKAWGPGAASCSARWLSFLTLSSTCWPFQYQRGASTTVTLRPSDTPCRRWQTLGEEPKEEEEEGEAGATWPRMVSAEAVFPQPRVPSRTRVISEVEG